MFQSTGLWGSLQGLTCSKKGGQVPPFTKKIFPDDKKREEEDETRDIPPPPFPYFLRSKIRRADSFLRAHPHVGGEGKKEEPTFFRGSLESSRAVIFVDSIKWREGGKEHTAQ